MQKELIEVKNIFDNHIERLVKEYNIKLIYTFGSYGKGTNTKKIGIWI